MRRGNRVHSCRECDTRRLQSLLQGLAHLQASDAKPLTSNAIAETQWLLNRLGYLKGEGGGIMGAKSTAAIRNYQGDRGFTVTGRPSMELLAKLRAEPIREPGADNF